MIRFPFYRAHPTALLQRVPGKGIIVSHHRHCAPGEVTLRPLYVTIRFLPHAGNIASGLFGCTVLKINQTSP